MDSESLKIRDLFLEVLQPLVNRLCGFGVFYSKDAARVRCRFSDSSIRLSNLYHIAETPFLKIGSAGAV